MLKKTVVIPSKKFALNVVTNIAVEICQDVEMSTRRANEAEVMCIPVFDQHMREIAKGYEYEPTIYHIFSRIEDGTWILHKAMFYLWFKGNIETFKKLTGTTAEFKRVVLGFENMNSYVLKYKELFKNGKGEFLSTDDVVKEADLLWTEYKAQQLSLFD